MTRHAGTKRGLFARLLGPLAALLLLTVALTAGTVSAAESQTKASPAAAEGYSVYVIPVKMTVERGLASFLDRALNEAEEAGAALAVLEIDTPGGSLESAERIGERIRSAKVPTMAFVKGKAASAGAYIALNADRLYMSPGSTIGAAMVVNAAGEAVESPKIVSFWSKQMSAAAEMNGRDGQIAVGMVDPNAVVEIKGLNRTKPKGEIISLSADEALKAGYAEGQAETAEQAIAAEGLAKLTIIHENPSLAERISQTLTSPAIMTLLLIVGIAGVLIELIVPGFGVPGILGLLSFGLYFFGQQVAGFAGRESIVLFVAGVVFIVMEMFVPSFGILGLLGGAGIVSGVVTAAYDTGNAFESLGYALLIALALVVFVAYVFRRRGVWNRFILQDRLTAEQGFVPSGDDRELLVGSGGVTLSPLRPSGVAEIGGRRVDVISSGQFLNAGQRIEVVSVDGTRILVKAVQQE
ncbi:nodulation protein NfeD [Cohnella sp. GbtcB17]|uniref:NfeD family protein n=1 Tax=Cohnella sp. GbtcB17 TaxID=2824762 RepID=UPI001C2FFEC5|nr:NfeD family protein [Cohnella sp. GbtcB17]